MSKKVIVFNGSPRKNGNTSRLIDMFVKGAEESGNNVSRFNLHNMNIHGCLGCCKGGADKNSPCVQKDDMEKIYPEYEKADVVVFASPMYYWSITGQLKCAIDRLFAVAETNADYSNPKKDCCLLMAAEGDTEDNFEPVKHYYEALLRHLGWNDKGIVYAGGNMAIGDIEGKKELEYAYALGKSI